VLQQLDPQVAEQLERKVNKQQLCGAGGSKCPMATVWRCQIGCQPAQWSPKIATKRRLRVSPASKSSAFSAYRAEHFCRCPRRQAPSGVILARRLGNYGNPMRSISDGNLFLSGHRQAGGAVGGVDMALCGCHPGPWAGGLSPGRRLRVQNDR